MRALTTEVHGEAFRMMVCRPDGHFAVRVEQRALSDHCDEDLERRERIADRAAVRYCWTMRHVDPRYTEELALVDTAGTRTTLRSRLPWQMMLDIADSLQVVDPG